MCVGFSEGDQEITVMFKVCNRVRGILTVQLRHNTACTCCVAELRLAGGKRTSWGARLQDLGSTRNTRTVCRSTPCLPRSWKNTQEEEKNMPWLLANTFTLRDFLCKSSSHTGKQRPLLCKLPQHCSWKRIPHLSPPPPAITVISPICLCQWQVSWSCSLYSFSHKSLLIVSLEACCASPALGPWQSADLGPSSLNAWTFGLCLGTNSLQKSIEHYSCQSRLWSLKPWFLVVSVLTLGFCHIPFFVITVTQWGPLKTGDYDRFQAPLQVIWHLNQVPLFWLDPLPQLYLGWKDLSSHWLLCSLPALFDNLLGGRTCHLMRLLLWVWIENIYDSDRGLKAPKSKLKNW